MQVLRTISAARQRDVLAGLTESSLLGRNYVIMVVLSSIIATFGLVQDSPAVIIGAMLIAPLMSPIIAFSLALVLGDLGRAGRALLTLVVGVALAIGISVVLGQAVSTGRFNFLEQLPAEILGRTHPTLFDLAIALAGGAAAAYALARPELSATLPGVAIATALMPPICTVGIGLALGRNDLAGGAFLLFLANFVAISFACSIVFGAVGFRPIPSETSRTTFLNPMILSGILLLVVAVPLGIFTLGVAADSRENSLIQSTMENQLLLLGDSTLVSIESTHGPTNDLEIVATVRSPLSLTYEQSLQMQRELAARLKETVALKLLVVPVTQLDPLSPPTPTPVSQSAATALPTIAPSPSPTIQLSPTPTPTIDPTVTTSATPTTTPSLTSTPTSTLSPTLTPLVYGVIGGTNRLGANIRREPGLSAVIAGLPDGQLVQLTGAQATVDAAEWIEVVLPDGRVGWVDQAYLVPYQDYRGP